MHFGFTEVSQYSPTFRLPIKSEVETCQLFIDLKLSNFKWGTHLKQRLNIHPGF